MESKDLKITAGNFIVESDLSKAGKLQMLKFIRHEASDHQLMAILLDGEIIDLDEQAEQIVEDRFKVQEALTGRERDFFLGRINRVFGECAKKCGRIALSKEKRLCKERCKNARDAAILKARAQRKADKRTAKTDKLAANVKYKQTLFNKKRLEKSKAKVAGRQ